jgi:hypothetical protein
VHDKPGIDLIPFSIICALVYVRVSKQRREVFSDCMTHLDLFNDFVVPFLRGVQNSGQGGLSDGTGAKESVAP